MVLLEAMWAGVPIVATAVGGVPDVLRAGDALLCAGGDVGALAEAVNRMAAEPSLRASLALQARARVAHEFALDGWLDAHALLYQRFVRTR
jgi:2-deoxystreptamine N-acetyl-D-glucosaminyltransferase/2-deoxystreptamine glucosyltransferase